MDVEFGLRNMGVKSFGKKKIGICREESLDQSYKGCSAKEEEEELQEEIKEKGYCEYGNETSVFITCCSTSWTAEHLMASQLDPCFM